ncbi:Protein of unknown function [Gryllus bimaculatus]|nr:Protein of unknown function [Gryllus bimaculatus]
MCPTRRDAEKEVGIHARSEIWRALHKASRSLECHTSGGLAKVADIMLIISVLVAAIVITSSRIPVASEVCSKGAAQDVTFSINGRRNVTGHWIIKVKDGRY